MVDLSEEDINKNAYESTKLISEFLTKYNHMKDLVLFMKAFLKVR